MIGKGQLRAAFAQVEYDLWLAAGDRAADDAEIAAGPNAVHLVAKTLQSAQDVVFGLSRLRFPTLELCAGTVWNQPLVSHDQNAQLVACRRGHSATFG